MVGEETLECHGDVGALDGVLIGDASELAHRQPYEHLGRGSREGRGRREMWRDMWEMWGDMWG